MPDATIVHPFAFNIGPLSLTGFGLAVLLAFAISQIIAQRELGTREGAAAHSLNLARGYFQLARIEQHHGKKTNAKRMALRALEEDPSLLPAQRLLRELGPS